MGVDGDDSTHVTSQVAVKTKCTLGEAAALALAIMTKGKLLRKE
jgi:hypothetical protein